MLTTFFQVRRISRLDDPRFHGRPVPRRGLRVAGVVARKPGLHRSAGEDQIRIPHHHGRGEEVNGGVHLCPIFLLKEITLLYLTRVLFFILATLHYSWTEN